MKSLLAGLFILSIGISGCIEIEIVDGKLDIYKSKNKSLEGEVTPEEAEPIDDGKEESSSSREEQPDIEKDNDPFIYPEEIKEESLDSKSDKWVNLYETYEDINTVNCKAKPDWCQTLVREGKLEESKVETQGENIK